MKRGAGILTHITSLPSPFGIGGLGKEAYQFADLLAGMKQRYWQLLPLNPTNRENGESPYFSSSAFAGNPLLIDLETLADERLLDRNDIADPEPFPDRRVDYERVKAYKMPLLEKAWNAFSRIGKDKGFNEFSEANEWWLDDYTFFIALKKRFKAISWSDWPDEIKIRRSAAMNIYQNELSEEIQKEKFYQYVFFGQWRRLKDYCGDKDIKIIGDIPIYVSFESADVWALSELFKLDDELKPVAVSGVPPDYFSATGQLWNNPVYSWENLKRTGYDWWASRMRAQFERYDIVRIDHFRGLVQYWEVPAGEATAINGSWQDVPTRDFLDTMLSNLAEFPVIAEDLGVITPDVREIMNAYGFPGMKILLFAFGEDNPHHPYLPHSFERNCVVYTGTHDNNTFRGWFENEANNAMRERLFRYLGRILPVDEACRELIRTAHASVADLAIIPLQDYLVLGEEARMNNPSQTAGNWLWRCTAGEMKSLPAGKILEMTVTYGRA